MRVCACVCGWVCLGVGVRRALTQTGRPTRVLGNRVLLGQLARFNVMYRKWGEKDGWGRMYSVVPLCCHKTNGVH